MANGGFYYSTTLLACFSPLNNESIYYTINNDRAKSVQHCIEETFGVPAYLTVYLLGEIIGQIFLQVWMLCCLIDSQGL